MKNKTKTLAVMPTTGSTHTEISTAEQITDEVVAAELAKKNARDNTQDSSHTEDLGRIARGVIASYTNEHTFSFEDFLVMAQPLDIPFRESKTFFEKWVRALQNAGRCLNIESIYDFPIYKIL